jgi:DNA-binding transcriptional LysR family regulator
VAVLGGRSVNVELRHLRYFVAVAEEASFTAASRRLYVAQQVLSEQVRQLEGTLGVGLLHRSSRGVTLTPAGEAFLEGARDTLARLDRAEATARNVAGAETGVLTVGLGTSTPGEVSSALLREFECLYPGVTVRFKSFDLAHPSAGLLDHSTDAAFVRPPVSAAEVELVAVASKTPVFVMPDTHPLAGLEEIGLHHAGGFPWIAAPLAVDGCDPLAWRNYWLCVPRPGGVAPVIGAVGQTKDEFRQHVMSGRGLALCWDADVTTVPAPGLAIVPGRGMPPATLSVAWRADDANPLVRHFVDVVTSAVVAVGNGGAQRADANRRVTPIARTAHNGQPAANGISP